VSEKEGYVNDAANALAHDQAWQEFAKGRWVLPSCGQQARSLRDSMDGAGHFRTLVGVLTPTAVPAIMTLSVLIFMYTWNDFLLALVMNPGGRLLTAPLALSYFAGAQRTTDQTVVAAAAVLVALPIVIAYMALQRQFIRGFLTGAIRE
jgi:raffinose/stachyose/melibiose transport system permease protein